ncbi:hypothetical protein AGMMS49938_10850 [Fibrobacterales bacterium]|nr:hypothetical protein AGMMS49938_10850 [Fibrobacterales bacterium]
MEEKLPLWMLALKANPESFGVMPADFVSSSVTWQDAEKAEKIVQKSKSERQTLKYVTLGELCAGVQFLEGLATAFYFWKKNEGEKIFLRGGEFSVELAKAIFVRSEERWVSACEKFGDKNYFEKCLKELEDQGFATDTVAAEGNLLSGESWQILYKTVLLLAEEYLQTKGDLPIIDCDSALAKTDENFSLVPVKVVPCSSDFLAVGSEFFNFLCKNFPCNNSVYELQQFLSKIYDEYICENLDWLHRAVISGTLPYPNFMGTGIMEANKLGAYKDKKIYLNHRLALNALHSPHGRFLLLMTMLHEYGHFLDDILCEHAGISRDSEGEEGSCFANKFLEYASANLYDTDFPFADFNAPDPEGDDQRFSLSISDFTYEQRKAVCSYFEFSENLENGTLTIPNGDIVDDAEFFGWQNASNFISSTHQNLTKAGAKFAEIKWTTELNDGSIWCDFPSEDDLEVAVANMGLFFGLGREKNEKYKTDVIYKSHFGEKQIWHSMCPKLAKVPTNAEVKNLILNELEMLYNSAMNYKKKGDTKHSHFEIGKLCHTLQDSFVLAHCWRRYAGDHKFLQEEKEISIENHGKIWTFQDYAEQDGNFHAIADAPKQKGTQTIGYKSAEEATKQILFRYSQNLEWNGRNSALSSPKEYLNNQYAICEGRENLPSGGSHPLFKNNSKFTIDAVRAVMFDFSLVITD